MKIDQNYKNFTFFRHTFIFKDIFVVLNILYNNIQNYYLHFYVWILKDHKENTLKRIMEDNGSKNKN